MFKRRFREYFTYTKKERNGIVVLLSVLILLILVRVYLNSRSYGNIVLMTDEFRKDIQNFEKGLTPKKEEQYEVAITSYKRKEKSEKSKDSWIIPDEIFEFNPNNVSKSELKKLGFSEKQTETLLNYRKSGGRFFQKDDLLKIYGIEKEQYKALEPYIFLENEEQQKKTENKNTFDKENHFVIDLNTASKDDLEKLKGIGSTYAERIIKYRKLLGGFYNNKQLFEVYGMDSARYKGFCDHISMDTNALIKININEANYDSLIRHPYLNKYQTEAILKYKNLMGDFSKIEQIYQNNILSKDEFLRIKPYLKLK